MARRLTVRRLRSREREAALARLAASPRDNLLVIDAVHACGIGGAPGEVRSDVLAGGGARLPVVLGQIYGYRETGIYFGVHMSNFYGWLLVGFVLVGALQILDRQPALVGCGSKWLLRIPGIGLLGPVLYLSVLVFNLSVTFWIGELLLGLVGVLLVGVFLVLGFFMTLYKLEHVTATD